MMNPIAKSIARMSTRPETLLNARKHDRTCCHNHQFTVSIAQTREARSW